MVRALSQIENENVSKSRYVNFRSLFSQKYQNNRIWLSQINLLCHEKFNQGGTPSKPDQYG